MEHFPEPEKNENIHEKVLNKLHDYRDEGYLFHGSNHKFTVVKPHQATDESTADEHHNMKGVYATDTPELAVAAGLLSRKDLHKDYTSSWNKKSDDGVLESLDIDGDDNTVLRPGYIYVVPADAFEKHTGSNNRDDFELVSTEAVDPIDIVAVNPNILDYIPEVETDLLRTDEKLES